MPRKLLLDPSRISAAQTKALPVVMISSLFQASCICVSIDFLLYIFQNGIYACCFQSAAIVLNRLVYIRHKPHHQRLAELLVHLVNRSKLGFYSW